ncbi:MAG TPA: DUF3943 domain-containing protein [Myxococcales bacterium]|nr:DUF3943 domain-containing protein [Myxococcales bacterium]
MFVRIGAAVAVSAIATAARAETSAPEEAAPEQVLSVGAPGFTWTPKYAADRYRLPPPYTDPAFVKGPVPQPDKAYFIALAEVVGIDLAIWGYDYLTGAPFAQISIDSISDNLSKGWIVDTDDFWANGLLHPIHGNLTFNAARTLGLNFYESFAYSFLGSFIWEQFLEIQPPSMNDQVNTPFGGTILGESLFRISRLILDSGGYKPSGWRQFFAFLVNPVGGLNRLAFGDKYRGELLLPESWIGEFNFGAVVLGSDKVGGSGETQPSIGPWASFGAHVVYNVPGTPGISLKKPFDHFELSGSISLTNQATATMMIRGLLLGDPIGEGGDFGGLWGLFTSYDFIAPEIFRVQGFGLGPGVSLMKRWDWFELHGTTLVEFLPWSGGGSTQPLGVRDYHYGPGGDIELLFRLHFSDRVTLRLEGREYWITGFYASGQSENITYAKADTTVRIYDVHGASVSFDFTHRQAHYPFEPQIYDRAAVLSVYYTFLQGW